MNHFGLLLIMLGLSLNAKSQINRQLFEFEFKGVLLNGVLNIPENPNPRGLVLLVHGSGQTNAVAQEWYYDVRERLVEVGYTVYMWDKRGCGKSGGTFDYNQTVENSAQEVIAAINTLREKQIPGAEAIGLWGISRAGWINPLVIQLYQKIEFWISVSGVDEKENFKYLLEQNLRINGQPEETIDLLVDEWIRGNQISHAGKDYRAFLSATPNLRYNKFWLRFTNGGITEQSYDDFQSYFMKQRFDDESGLQIYIENFDSILSGIRCPVLALFGEKDMNVDWKKTKILYENHREKYSFNYQVIS